MNEVIDFAKEQKCPFIYVETMSYQALSFYKKFGFEIELKRDGFSNDMSYCYMKKDLD